MAVVLAIYEGLLNNEKASQAVAPQEESEDDQVAQPGEQQATEDSETTPLLGQHAHSIPPAFDEEDRTYYWWIFQLIISMSAPVINLATVYLIWIGAMPQTIPDGGWVGIGMFYSPPLFGIR